ncbi:MAG: hypothetical protein ACYS6W_13405 [Planctomycetota bacterium]|jgi:hypothetical protein
MGEFKQVVENLKSKLSLRESLVDTLRSRKFWIPTVIGIGASLIVFFVTFIAVALSGGLEYNTLSRWIGAVYPWGCFVNYCLFSENILIVIMMILQFTIYGLILWSAQQRGKLRVWAIRLTCLHILLVILPILFYALVGILSGAPATFFMFVAVFPWAYVVCGIMDEGCFSSGFFFEMSQFIVYGAIIGIGWHRNRLRLFTISVLVAHVLMSALVVIFDLIPP